MPGSPSGDGTVLFGQPVLPPAALVLPQALQDEDAVLDELVLADLNLGHVRAPRRAVE